ncbi:MAG TPA: hypothetical protein VFJ72_15455 [Rubrobacteraceae bacterium]|nr:hypothetical protein [Rubrobacteraceae bacterium]
MRRAKRESSAADLRLGHLLRVNGDLEIAILSMWMRSPRAKVMIGMAQASLRGEGPGGTDADLLEKLRPLVIEAREFYADDDFPAAMARMRVAHDLVGLRIISVGKG